MSKDLTNLNIQIEKEVKSAIAPRPKKQFPLVGTHIKTVNISG